MTGPGTDRTSGAMLDRADEALAFLLSRRSRPPKTLGGPAPEGDALNEILTAALRVPDHAALEPWRLIVMGPEARAAMAAAIRASGRPEADRDKASAIWDTSPLCVAVIESPVESDKAPPIEQTYSTGAVCAALVNASLAAGWGAGWVTGWPSHDAALMQDTLGLAPHERVAGFVHIGTTAAAPPERPRPHLAAKVERRP